MGGANLVSASLCMPTIPRCFPDRLFHSERPFFLCLPRAEENLVSASADLAFARTESLRTVKPLEQEKVAKSAVRLAIEALQKK